MKVDRKNSFRRSFKAAPTQRQRRVGEEIRHKLSTIINRDGLPSEALNGVPITITEVRVSPDLRNASVFVMPLGGENQDIVVDALNSVSSSIRFQLAKGLRLRSVPTLRFVPDLSYDKASHLDSILNSSRVAQDLNEK